MSEGGEFAGSAAPGDSHNGVTTGRYRTLVDAVDDGLFQLDAEATIIDTNDAIADAVGRSRDELVGEHVAAILGDDAERSEATVAELRDGPDDAATLELLTDPAVADAGFEELRIALVEEDGEFRGSVGVLRAGAESDGESQLQESEQRFRSLVDAVEEYAIFMLDPDGRVVTWNEGAERIKGYAQDEIVSQHFSTFYTDEDQEEGVPAANLDAAMAEGWVEDEGWRVRADGSRFWANVTITAVRDDDGTLRGFAKVTRDMTERRERERELRRERDLNEKLLRTAPVAIAVHDSDGETVLSNDRAREVLGLSQSVPPEELDYLQDGRWDIYDADGRPLPADALPAAKVLESGEAVADEEIAIDRPDGERRWFRVNAVPLFDAEETIDRVVVAGEDVTEIKRRERQLRRRRNELESELDEVFGRVSDAFFALDEEFRFTHINERAHELINPEDRELVGESIWDQFPEATERLFKPHYERAMENQETVSFEEYYPEPLDTWFEVRAYPSESGLSVYFRDITERKERERELEESERRFTAIFEDPNILVGLLEPDGTVVDINRTAMDYVDADLGEVIDEPFWETPWWGGQDDAKREVKEWTERAASGEYVDFEAGLTRPGGEEYTLEGFFRPVTNDEGEVVSIVVSDRDVSDRKQREAELRERERQLTTLMDNVPGMVYRCQNEPGWPMEFVSDAAREITGYAPDEFERGEVSYGDDVIVEEDREKVWESVQRAIEARESFSVTYRIETAGDDTRWVRSDGRGVFEDGALVDVEGIISDVTERKRLEAELTESERRYRTLAEYFPNGVVTLVDNDLEYTLAAGQGFDRIPVDPEDLEGNSFRDAWDEDTVEILEPAFQAALDGEESSVELRYADREWIFQAVPITDERGDVFAGMTMAIDVTERKEQERALEQYSEYLDDVIDGIDDLFYVLDPDGTLRRWNESVADVTGYSLPEIASMDALDFFGDDAEKIASAIADGFEEGSVLVEADLVTSHGEPIPYEFSATTVENPAGDTVLAGIGRDVSEQKARERELTKYETIVETIEDGIYVKDEDGYFTMVNEAYAAMTGYDPQELVGEHASLVADEATIEDSRELVSAAASGDDEPTMEASLRTKGGGEIPTEGTFATIEADDERKEVGVIRDITERRERRRKLEESNERLEQFAYAASHDLQEPLRMVSSYLSLVERRYADELDEDGREFIEFAVDGAERMREMIDALLKYSRVETRGDPFEPVDLEEVYEDAIQDLEVKIVESGAEIEAEPLPDVYGDEGQLRQVLQNLLSNAIEYSEDGPPQVGVDAERDGDRWIVSVSDEGIGIEPEHADRVFEVFNRLHTREEHEGTGIGLALCRRIAERHGGEIWVESEPGDGSTFYFTVPAQGVDDD